MCKVFKNHLVNLLNQVFQESALVFHSLQSNFNPDFYPSFSAILFNDTEGVQRVNLSLTLNTDFFRTTNYLEFRFFADKASEISSRNGFKGTIDSCKVSKGVFGNFIIQMVANNIEKYSNYSFECTLKKGSYYVRNFPLKFDNIPQSFFIEGRKNFEISLAVKGRASIAKSPLVNMFLMKFFGESIN